MSGPRTQIPATETRSVAGFVTYRSFLHRGRVLQWRARQHRKGLLRHPDQTTVPFWHSAAYNWWTGLSFSLGSLLFMLGATLSLIPTGLSAPQVGMVFFAGSIPFTIAGFMQNFQAANAGDFSPERAVKQPRLRLFGWLPHNLGWLSTISQFFGTVAFNFNTFDAIHPASGWVEQDLTIWVPGLVGSVLFLISGYLAFMETSDGYWSWKPRDLDWWIVAINLLGCIFFMVAGIVSYVPSGTEPGWILKLANSQLWLGGLCFLIGAVLLMRESRQAETSRALPA